MKAQLILAAFIDILSAPDKLISGMEHGSGFPSNWRTNVISLDVVVELWTSAAIILLPLLKKDPGRFTV